MFPDNWVERLQQGTLEFDCDSITLEQEAGQTLFRGPGTIRQSPNGGLGFKMFPGEVRNRSPYLLGFEDGTAGKLLDGRHYYRFQATDRSGDVWAGRRTLPDVNASIRTRDAATYVVVGELYELERMRERYIKSDTSRLTLYIHGDFSLAHNTGTQRITRVNDKDIRQTGTLDRSQVAVGDLAFDMHTTPGLLTVTVTSGKRFPPFLEMRIVEALRFVLARPLTWGGLELMEGDAETTRIRPKTTCPTSWLHPPLASSSLEAYRYMWPLFSRFLTFVLPHGKASPHPCAVQLSDVLTASTLSLDSLGLALGIAVEGLTKCLYPDVGTPSDEWQAAVKAVRKFLAGWTGEAETPIEIVSRIKDRVGGMVGNLSSVSPQDRLHALAERGAIDKGDIKLWKELRHPAAHADSREGRDTQKFVDQCHAVTTLMYHLIFSAIGYQGKYTDYSTYDYPPRMYRGRPITHDDIATAAYYRWQQRGELPGGDLEDWLAAEKLLQEGVI